MFIYWFIWIFISFNTFLLGLKRGVYSLYSEILFRIFVLFLCLFIGFRYRVGADWGNYLLIYDFFKYVSFSESWFISDPAYSFLNYLSQNLNLEDTILVNAVCAVIISLFLYLSFKKLFKEYWLLTLIYYPYHILSVSLGYTRQSVALAIITYALTFLIEGNIIKYVLLIVLASLFHKTAIIFLLFIPVILIKRKFILYSYMIVSLVFLLGILYISFLSRENIYLNSDYGINSSGVFVRLSMHIIPIFMYIFFYKKLFRFLPEGVKYILTYFILLIIFCAVIAIPFSTLSDRFNLYLIFFDLFVILKVYLYVNFYNRMGILLLLLVYYTGFIYIWLVYGTWASKAWIPYSNYITNYLFQSVF